MYLHLFPFSLYILPVQKLAYPRKNLIGNLLALIWLSLKAAWSTDRYMAGYSSETMVLYCRKQTKQRYKLTMSALFSPIAPSCRYSEVYGLCRVGSCPSLNCKFLPISVHMFIERRLSCSCRWKGGAHIFWIHWTPRSQHITLLTFYEHLLDPLVPPPTSLVTAENFVTSLFLNPSSMVSFHPISLIQFASKLLNQYVHLKLPTHPHPSLFLTI